MANGYEITLGDFLSLCRQNGDAVGPLLEVWFRYRIVPQDRGFLGFVIHDERGLMMDPEAVHREIQSDWGRQTAIYQLAMSIWR